MRFKTVATFENYEVVEPTEPVKRIKVIDIRKRSVASVPVKQHKHKISKDEPTKWFDDSKLLKKKK